MTRIAMVVLSTYPADPRVRREAEALGRNGIGVDVICLRAAGEEKEETLGTVRVHRIMPVEEKEQLLKYVWLSARFLAASFWKLQRLAAANHYEVIQVHNMPDYLVFAALVQRLRGKRVILDLHDLMVELFESRWNARKTRLLGPFVRLAEKISCRFSNHLITTSAGFQARLLERGVPPGKITLVLNSADHNIFRKTPREFRRIETGAKLLYHGTVAPRFGIHVAIEAVALLQKDLPGTKLHVHGKYDPSYRAELDGQIERLGLKDHVMLRGYVPLEEIAKVIAGCDIGIVPYLSDSFMNLALSTKAFEYVATGLPVVASNLPSINSIFSQDCMEFFEPGSAGDLAAKILRLCSSPEIQRSRTENASRCYESISWPMMEERYVSLIRKHLARSARP
jgi:glycosyltransferase involved in cell wall biosynthesis